MELARLSPSTTMSGETLAHYMVLSVKHVMLCYGTNRASLKHTAPEPLFNDDYGTRPSTEYHLGDRFR